MNRYFKKFTGMKDFLLLWLTQTFSSLGSSMTSFALILWSYRQTGSALSTALLSVCSYAPYILMSILAGALSDRWNKKTVMLVCDALAALGTVIIALLYFLSALKIWHLYLLNAFSGLMNTVQQPASDVASTLLTPKERYPQASSLRSFGGSLVNIITPVCASALMALAGVEFVFLFDLLTFGTAFFVLLCFIKLPDAGQTSGTKEPVLKAAKIGLQYLKKEKGIFHLILFLAAINLTASIYNAALPAMVLTRGGGSETAYGILNTVTGVTLLLGSILASGLPKPKSRIKIICNTLLVSMSTENFFLALGQSLPVWCIGAFLGWIFIPLMNANLDTVMRSRIPLTLQGRVYSVRNTFQFFTIPIGYGIGGSLVDHVFEPLMARQGPGSLLCRLFGSGKGSGAAFLFLLLGFFGVITCLIFRHDKAILSLEPKSNKE
ncbi:MAG: MFS transporter [Clostridiales bacterium]|nr:MFS transporter [Clostridiales bacterium]